MITTTLTTGLVVAPELALPSLDNTYGALFLGMVFGLMYVLSRPGN